MFVCYICVFAVQNYMKKVGEKQMQYQVQYSDAVIHYNLFSASSMNVI